jgi:HAD superfamily hydrolase (TIGR01509 family)
MDGVLTRTASVHAAAWKRMFDDYLEHRANGTNDTWRPFSDEDYQQYVDGRIRVDGTRAFLASRNITLPEGRPDDPPSAETLYGLGNRKNELVLQEIETHGVDTYPDAVQLLRAAHAAGLGCAVVSASANTARVLEVTGLAGLVDARIDGIVAHDQQLAGKPAPDTFLAGAAALGVQPAAAAVFEDAVAGVAAGRAGAFGLVVGVDRVGHGHAADLQRAGADVVLADLSQLGAQESHG